MCPMHRQGHKFNLIGEDHSLPVRSNCNNTELARQLMITSEKLVASVGFPVYQNGRFHKLFERLVSSKKLYRNLDSELDMGN